jgi:flagellar hook protein FlgE
MSLTSSLYIGQSGLDSSSTQLSVIGDNIANANTIGFKQGRAAFEDLLGASMIPGGQAGLGSRLQAIQRLLAQGAITDTGVATDLSLSGGGFFVVKGQHDGESGQFLTRAGQFSLDKQGTLVNLSGLHVQGFAADANGALSGVLGDLQAGNAVSLPHATGTVTVKANLDASAAVLPAWDPANPATTANFSSSTTAFDSLGKEHQVQIYYRLTPQAVPAPVPPSRTWEVHALTDGAGVAGGTAGTPVEIAAGTLTFDASGKLAAATQSGSFTPAGAVSPQALAFVFGDPTGAGGTGVSGVTQFAAPSAVTFTSQDGYRSGTLSNLNIDATGTIQGAFSNGQTRVLGQVAVATVPAADQLERRGANLFGLTPGAGQLSAGQAGEGGRGSIIAGALEQSNVDLSAEFVRMISAQRAFQANSKTVQTADQLLQELMQLKR